MKKAFQDMLHELGEVNPTHAYHNGSRTSKDNEDPSWSISFKTRRTQKTSSALKDFICVVIIFDRNIIQGDTQEDKLSTAMMKNTRIGSRDVGFGREKQAKKNLKASYGVTTPQELHSIMAEGDIDNLTIEQYLALTRWNQAPGVVKPDNKGNVNFEIKIQFMQELREDTFSGNKNNDAHEHVERVLDIVRLFNILGVTHDAVMLRIFPITLTRFAESWVERLSLGTVDSWDLLKKVFIQRYCPPFKTTKKLEELRNFKQEGDETL
ncbi:hypothetical protein Tco_0127167 [Tanacetum coccineum]